jgi:general secretion pathway protein D
MERDGPAVKLVALASMLLANTLVLAQAANPPAASLAAEPALSWQVPAQVKAGEQFSAVLRVNSHRPLRSLPLLLGFDPQLLQVVTVQEGEFFKQANGQTAFTHRTDPAKGKIVVAVVRQSAGGRDPSVNGAGSVVTVTFKALKPAASAKMQLLSASPEPASASPVKVPVEQAVRIVP